MDPLNLAEHQGTYGPEVFLARQEVGHAIDIWKKSLNLRTVADDTVLSEFAQSCQNAGPIEIRFHKLALVAKQILIARNGQYSDSDRDFIASSLRLLIPGVETEETIDRLKDPTLEFFQPKTDAAAISKRPSNLPVANPPSGKLLLTIEGTDNEILSVTVSPD